MNRDELLAVLREDVLLSAPALLGATLIRGEMKARIVEVEAYRSDDPACHAFQRRTPRTEILYGPPGIAYVYFNYGVHWMLNIVTHDVGDAAAVLFRAAIPVAGLEEMEINRQTQKPRELLSGPGKLARAFGITGEDNGANLLSTDPLSLHLEPASTTIENIVAGPRIGIAKGKWEDVPWRFMDGDALEWVSRKP